MSLFRFFRFEKLTRLELQREKAKDYRNVVILQILIVGCGLLLSEPLLAGSTSPVSKFIILIFSAFGATYAFLLWDLLRNFTSNRYLITTIFIVLTLIVVVGTLVEFPYYQILSVPNRQAYLLTIHGLLFPIEVTVIGFAIRDIFAQGYLTPDKLWGAACVFLMIGISFGSLYDLLSIAMPGSMGVAIELGLPNYAECVTYSFCVLSGMDSGLQPIRFIRNLSVLEAVWGTLYGMIIIGKLLGLPRQEDTPKN
ncbi:MAG: hypothetical protein ACK5DD_15795 [Cyclobacteriaceae bacterium]|jgi:asparagine N-glycosylation enzyme membrane subunit Stt3